MEQIFYQLGRDKEMSESTGHRLEMLLDLQWDEDGYAQKAVQTDPVCEIERICSGLSAFAGGSVLLERRETERAAEMGPGTLYQAERNIG